MLGYLDLVRGLGHSRGRVPLELRVEGSWVYVLVPMEHTLLRHLDHTELNFVHDSAWAEERFLQNRSGRYLIGQKLGLSKFATLADLPKTLTKSAAIDALALNGYPAFDKPGTLYLVRVGAEAARDAEPMVPLVYSRIDGGPRSARSFGVRTVPGFTSGGKAEVVFRSFELSASDLSGLAERGVRIDALSSR